jgi:hypothetical protein
MVTRPVSEIVAAASQALKTAELGLADLASPDPDRRLSGAMNLAVFGRAVTNVLQNLRSVVEGFDGWYQPHVDQMRLDPLLRYFYDLRTEILKQGSLPLARKATVTFSSTEQLAALLGPPPAGAYAMVGVNQDGLSGWMVRLGDGSEQFYAVALPSGMATVTFHVPKPPTTHLGHDLGTDDLAVLGRVYCAYLKSLVDEASARFITA